MARVLGRRTVVGVVLPLSLLAAACAGSQGFSEDALVVYSGRQEVLVDEILDEFVKRTGIKTQVRYGNTAELAGQLVEEGDRSPADVFFAQDGGALGTLSAEGRLRRLPDELLDRVDPRFRADDGTWVGVSGRARVMVYDPSQLSEHEVPADVYELTEPRWRGKVGIAPSNASFEAFVTAMRVLDGDEATRRWLEGLAANDVQRFDNNILVLNAAEDGVIAVGLINHYYWYEQVAEEGLDAVPARLKYPRNGGPEALVNVAGVGILETTDKEDDARRLVDFLLSEQAQEYFADQTKEYPLVDGVATAEGVPPMSSLNPPDIDLSQLADLPTTLRMIEEAGLT